MQRLAQGQTLALINAMAVPAGSAEASTPLVGMVSTYMVFIACFSVILTSVLGALMQTSIFTSLLTFV